MSHRAQKLRLTVSLPNVSLWRSGAVIQPTQSLITENLVSLEFNFSLFSPLCHETALGLFSGLPRNNLKVLVIWFPWSFTSFCTTSLDEISCLNAVDRLKEARIADSELKVQSRCFVKAKGTDLQPVSDLCLAYPDFDSQSEAGGGLSALAVGWFLPQNSTSYRTPISRQTILPSSSPFQDIGVEGCHTGESPGPSQLHY
ncbi:hypothetical protein GYMLUDRAFT_59208 [Collybiopsis luxurians FD-317 M1]|uniref:Uncharacterized protein n=1 Tax=Collybiopsis luxurians FD-317 M1 TaxID=944289 RepID=A0A0D0CE43_9AGAR|nr:hypothetical protein GYMLUDRAFT_59208 [Collybiopsis luxurians FD-317 M1]